MLELSKSELINLMKEMGADGWHLYSILRLEARNDVVNLKQEELAEMLGVSIKTVYNRMNKLSAVKIQDKQLVKIVDKKQDCNVIHIISIEVGKILQVGNKLPVTSIDNTSKDLKDIKELATGNELPITETVETKQPMKPKDALIEWGRKYTEKYGVNYAISWGRDTKLMKKLLDTYGEERLMEIFDVILRLYSQKWQSKQYTRPTIGQMSSWLAVQAEPYASANMEDTKEKEEFETVEITTEDGTDLMDEWEKRGWI
jgi:DNA-binding Lrp family transcriptional regulator